MSTYLVTSYLPILCVNAKAPGRQALARTWGVRKKSDLKPYQVAQIWQPPRHRSSQQRSPETSSKSRGIRASRSSSRSVYSLVGSSMLSPPPPPISNLADPPGRPCTAVCTSPRKPKLPQPSRCAEVPRQPRVRRISSLLTVLEPPAVHQVPGLPRADPQGAPVATAGAFPSRHHQPRPCQCACDGVGEGVGGVAQRRMINEGFAATYRATNVDGNLLTRATIYSFKKRLTMHTWGIFALLAP